ncbi:MAG TPA: hypothetical protein VIM99_06665 [Blastocatellia bacterium]
MVSKVFYLIPAMRGAELWDWAYLGMFIEIRNRLPVIGPQSAIAYAIFPGEVALSAIGEFQIKEVANHEKNGDAGFLAGFLDYFCGPCRACPIRVSNGAGPDASGKAVKGRIFSCRPG